jgi:predicted house-cleaning NTP pyrophosphatase (Maf/HAM1 superfamily)
LQLWTDQTVVLATEGYRKVDQAQPACTQIVRRKSRAVFLVAAYVLLRSETTLPPEVQHHQLAFGKHTQQADTLDTTLKQVQKGWGVAAEPLLG